jgi:hypothetical protein
MNTVSHGNTRVYEGMESRFDDLQAQKKEIDGMREDIKNNPNLSDDQKEAMLADLDRAEASVDRALDYSTASGKYDTTSGNTRNDGDLAAVEAALGSAEASMNHVETQLAISAQSSQPVSGPSGPSGSQGTSGAGGTQGASSGSNVSGTQGSSGSGSAGGGMSIADMDIDDMVTKMSNDPQAAMEELQKLPPKERGMALQAINTQLQQINQMFSMMSNMMKSLHDTAKAAINNMRV